MTGQIVKAYKKDLTLEDLFELDEYELSKSLTSKFEKNWNEISQKSVSSF